MRFKSRSRAMAVAALAASVSLAGLTTVAPAGAAPASTDRVAGVDRYETAADAATAAYATADTVVVASGEPDNLPDALSANGIAGAENAPILLVMTDSIPQATSDALDTLNPTNVIIVGGSAAVSDAVESELDADYTVTRLEGQNRFGTAADVATELGVAPDIDPDGAGAQASGATVALADGFAGGLADAVAASPMLHQEEIPLLLTNTDSLPAETEAALDALNVEQVLALGGTAAISEAVEAELEGMGINVERLAGGDRFGTSTAIADFEVDFLGFDPSTTYIANGFSIADALAGGPLASVNNGPIVTVSETDVPGATEQWLEDNAADIDEVVALGGTAVINDGVLQDAARLADESLQQNQVTLTSSSVQQGGTLTGTITGDNIQSVTVSGCGLNNQAIGSDSDSNTAGRQFRITIPPSQQAGSCTLTFTITDTNGNTVTESEQITVTAPTSQTARPELTSAQIVSTTPTAQATPGNPAGTVVRYTFDEAVGAVTNPANFNLYRFNAPNTQLDANSASIDPNNANSVLARFNALTNDPGVAAANTADLSLATVDLDAVTDGQGLQNPIGDAAVGTGQQTTTLTAGRTAAPDLLTVQGFRQAQAANFTAVDFVFDQAAYTQTAGGTGFELVRPDNTVLACTGPANNSTVAGGQAVAGGNGTTTITAICPNPAGQATPIQVAQVARGTVDEDTVGTTPAAGIAVFPGVGGAACDAANAQGTTNRCNPLQASDTPNTGTIAPDLESVRFVAATTPGGNETVIFVFDQAVQAAGAPNLFQVYKNDTSDVAGIAPTTINTGGDRTEVAVTFPNGTIANATGGNVLDNAVTGTGGQSNQQDEAAATNVEQPGPAGSAGRTAAPDLVSVTLSQGGTFGNDWRATYTFDEAINTAPGTAVAAPNQFRLFAANGQGFTATACNAGPAVAGTVTANSVICTGYSRFTSASNPAPSATVATNAEIGSATLGTVDNNAVTDAGGAQNPEGAEATSGGTGTPSA